LSTKYGKKLKTSVALFQLIQINHYKCTC